MISERRSIFNLCAHSVGPTETLFLPLKAEVTKQFTWIWRGLVPSHTKTKLLNETLSIKLSSVFCAENNIFSSSVTLSVLNISETDP